MAKIKDLKAGQIVSYKRWYLIKIIAVDSEGQYVQAKWNGNLERRFIQKDVSKWKASNG